jgi:hypothetical protein
MASENHKLYGMSNELVPMTLIEDTLIGDVQQRSFTNYPYL